MDQFAKLMHKTIRFKEVLLEAFKLEFIFLPLDIGRRI